MAIKQTPTNSNCQNFTNIIKELQENDCLKDKIRFQNNEIILEIHPDFILKTINGKTYLNDKFYQDIEEKDLLELYTEFLQNDKIVYIEYQHKHFNFHSNIVKSYFKEMQYEKYSLNKIKHLRDVEMIFTNKRVIYNNKMVDLTDTEIIERMYKESVDGNFEKVFYSSDKKERLIIYRNSVNSFSYQFEKVTIIDLEERRYYNCYAIWEPSYFDSNKSFYQSLDSLLNDLKPYIKGWHEKN